MRLSGQKDLFRSRLEQMINRKHPLCKLAQEIDWGVFEEAFGACYAEEVRRAGIAIRVVVGLHYLKYTYNESDESVVERFLENPYWRVPRTLVGSPMELC